MSRADGNRLRADGRGDRRAGKPARNHVKVAEDIGMAALRLAKRARAAGLTAAGHLLETAALEAAAEAAARQWRAEVSGK